MKFGVFDQNDFDGTTMTQQYAHRLRMIEHYDRLGFHIYQMSEHHGTPLSLAPSPSVFLAAASQRTHRIRLAPLVYLLPLYNPVRLVEDICMLEALAEGRFEFGIGRGASPHEARFLGVDPETLAERYTEMFEIVSQGLEQGVLNYSGTYFQIQNVPLSVRLDRNIRPQLWYAAGSPQSAQWPARNGFNLMTGGLTQKVRDTVAAFREEIHQARPDRSTHALYGMNRYIVVADTNSRAREIYRAAWRRFYISFSHLWREHGGAPKNAIVPEDGDQLIENGVSIVGTAAHVREQLLYQVEISGVNLVSGNFMFGDMAHEDAIASVELFAREVMPAFTVSERKQRSVC